MWWKLHRLPTFSLTRPCRQTTMKLLGKLCATVLVLSFAGAAFAAATLHDVDVAVHVNHDEVQGEKLMREVVAGDPGNARYHYILAQILDKNGKHGEALSQFNEMKKLDPGYSFEKEPSRVEIFGDKLANENAQHAAPLAPAATMAPPATPAVAPIPAPHKSGHTGLWIVLVLIVLGIGGWFLFRRTAEKDKAEDEARVKTLRQDQLKQANTLLESVKPLRLDMRMASPPNAALLAELDDAEKALIGLIERLSQAPVAQREIDVQSDNLAHLRRKFEGKADPAPQAAAQPTPEPVQDNAPQSVYQGNPGNGFGMPQQVNNGLNPVMGAGTNIGTSAVYQPAGYQQGYPQAYPQVLQQPMYVEQNSGMGAIGGLIAGVALGEMMSGGHHDREVVREIHEVREVPVYEEPRRQGPSDDIDFGDDNSSSSSGSGDVDFGSDDN